MSRPELASQVIIVERPSPPEEQARCRVCDREPVAWQPGMPQLGDDHNPNRRGPVRSQNERLSFDDWILRTLWYVAAP